MTTNNLPAKRAGRPSKAVYELRVKEVATMFLQAKTRSEIIEYCVQTYGIKETSCFNLITAAYKFIKHNHSIDREGVVAIHMELYYKAYASALALGDTRSAITALNSIEKLLRLTTDVAIQNNNLSLNLKDLSLSELKDLLKAKD